MPKRLKLRDAKAPARAASLLPPLVERLPDFIGAPAAPAQALAGLHLAFVGAGSVGLNLIQHCARLVPASMTIIDPKTFQPASYLTHSLLSRAALGRAKSQYAAQLAKNLSPSSRVRWYRGRVQDLPLDTLAEADVVFMATDNLPAEVETGQLCLHLRRPLVHVSLLGLTLSINVRLFLNATQPSPCPACAFGPAEWAQVSADTVCSCDGPGGSPKTPASVPSRTHSLSFISGLAADLGLVQFLRFRLNLGSPVANTNLEYCGYTHRSVLAPLAFNAHCPCDHTPFDLVTLPRPVGEMSLRQLANCAGASSAAPQAGVTIALDHLRWVESGACACPEPRPLRRFSPPGRVVAGRCRRCREPVRYQPFSTQPAASMPHLAADLDRPLRSLGAARARWALVRRGERAVLLRNLNPGPHSP